MSHREGAATTGTVAVNDKGVTLTGQNGANLIVGDGTASLKVGSNGLTVTAAGTTLTGASISGGNIANGNFTGTLIGKKTDGTKRLLLAAESGSITALAADGKTETVKLDGSTGALTLKNVSGATTFNVAASGNLSNTATSTNNNGTYTGTLTTTGPTNTLKNELKNAAGAVVASTTLSNSYNGATLTHKEGTTETGKVTVNGSGAALSAADAAKNNAASVAAGSDGRVTVSGSKKGLDGKTTATGTAYINGSSGTTLSQTNYEYAEDGKTIAKTASIGLNNGAVTISGSNFSVGASGNLTAKGGMNVSAVNASDPEQKSTSTVGYNSISDTVYGTNGTASSVVNASGVTDKYVGANGTSQMNLGNGTASLKVGNAGLSVTTVADGTQKVALLVGNNGIVIDKDGTKIQNLITSGITASGTISTSGAIKNTMTSGTDPNEATLKVAATENGSEASAAKSDGSFNAGVNSTVINNSLVRGTYTPAAVGGTEKYTESTYNGKLSSGYSGLNYTATRTDTTKVINGDTTTTAFTDSLNVTNGSTTLSNDKTVSDTAGETKYSNKLTLKSEGGTTITNSKTAADGAVTSSTSTVTDSAASLTHKEGKTTTGTIKADAAGATMTGTNGSKVTAGDSTASMTVGNKGITVTKDGTTVAGNLTVNGVLEVNGKNIQIDDVAETVGDGKLTETNGLDNKNLTTGLNSLSETVGDVSKLETTEKTTVVGAVNEVNTKVEDINIKIGDTSKFNDAVKNKDESGAATETSVVDAVNNTDTQARERDAALAEGLGNVNDRVDRLEGRLDRVGAMAAAAASLKSMGYDPAAPTEFAVGLGTYKGSQAIAFGVFHYPNKDFMLNISYSQSGSERMGGVGATWRFGRKDPDKAAAEKAQKQQEKIKLAQAQAAEALALAKAAQAAAVQAAQ